MTFQSEPYVEAKRDRFFHSVVSTIVRAVFLTLCVGCGSDSPADPAVKPSPNVALQAALGEASGDEEDFATFRDQRAVENSIVIGLDADMTSANDQAGEAIRRGALLAIDEINQAGGLMGRPLELIVRDHRGNPARGIDNMAEFVAMDDVLAVVGGLHTPVVLRELDIIHKERMLCLVPWAAGTPIIQNGHSPNYVFRVSVRDEYAGDFLVQSAIDRGITKMGLLLERTGWGRSNQTAMVTALESRQLKPTGVEWFNWGESDMSSHIDRLSDDGAEAILMVANPLEGAVVVNEMAARPVDQRLPIISHWGISGGDFSELIGESQAKVDLSVLQTFSFVTPRRPKKTAGLYEAYAQRFEDCQSPRDVFAPVGTAHAYEIVKLLAEAVKRAKSIDRSIVRTALEDPIQYEGVIRDYDPPFRPDHHDALTADDFFLARYARDGVIEPISMNGSDQPSAKVAE